MIGEMLVNGEGRPLTVLLGFGKWGRQIKPGPDWTRANLVAGQRPERPTKYKGIHQRPDGTWVAYYNRKSKGPFETEGEAIAARKALVAAGSKPR